jgi:hypothetical protein
MPREMATTKNPQAGRNIALSPSSVKGVSVSHTSNNVVRIRILTLKADKLLDGIVDVKRFKVGQVYEVGPRLADLLMASGHAMRERRRSDREPMSGESAKSG